MAFICAKELNKIKKKKWWFGGLFWISTTHARNIKKKKL